METTRNNRARTNQGLCAIHAWEQSPQGIHFQTSEEDLQLTWYTDHVVRVQIQKKALGFAPLKYAVTAEVSPVEFTVQAKKQSVVVESKSLKIEVKNSPARLTFKDKKGTVLNEDDAGLGTSWIGDSITTYKKLQKDEKFIGLGEKTGRLNRRGSGYVCWNTDNFAYHDFADPLYVSVPFYMGIHGGKVYGIYLNNSHKSSFNFGASNHRFSSFSVEGGDMDYFFIQGDTVADIIGQYTHLTGRMPLPPLWSLGYHQCRFSYYPEYEIRTIAQTFRDKKIPADCVVFDIHYMDAYKIFSWDKKRFPDPEKLIGWLKENGFHATAILDPGIKTEKGYAPYDDGVAGDVFVKFADGEYFEADVWPGKCHFPDFTAEKTREWWRNWVAYYVKQGLAGYWNDMNEPAAWGNFITDAIEFDNDGDKTSHREARNLYGFQMARSTYEGVRRHGADRPFVLTRSGFAGVQRYSAVWTGDSPVSEGSLFTGVRLLNSMGLSGIPFTGYDVAGFLGDASQELYSRWISIAAFSPFFRGHSMVNNRDAEPWALGEEVEDISRNYISFRYKLLPYLYSVFHQAAETGLPVVRSLAIDYTHDNMIYNGAYDSQYLFGPSLLIVPVASHQRITKAYLPEGNWYDLYHDKPYTGKQEVYAESPKERLPIYVKAGAIIPHQPLVQHTGEKPQGALELHVYYGNEKSKFVYYEDDGKSFDYHGGAYYKREIKWKPDDKKIVLGAVEGIFESKFTEVSIYFHGFDKLGKKAEVNGSKVDIKKANKRFFAAISSFDPLIPENDPYGEIENLPSITIPFGKEEIVVVVK